MEKSLSKTREAEISASQVTFGKKTGMIKVPEQAGGARPGLCVFLAEAKERGEALMSMTEEIKEYLSRCGAAERSQLVDVAACYRAQVEIMKKSTGIETDLCGKCFAVFPYTQQYIPFFSYEGTASCRIKNGRRRAFSAVSQMNEKRSCSNWRQLRIPPGTNTDSSTNLRLPPFSPS